MTHIVTAEQAEHLIAGKAITVVCEMNQPPEGWEFNRLTNDVYNMQRAEFTWGDSLHFTIKLIPHPVGSTVRMKYIDMVDRVSIHTAKVTDVRVIEDICPTCYESGKQWVAVTTLERSK